MLGSLRLLGELSKSIELHKVAAIAVMRRRSNRYSGECFGQCPSAKGDLNICLKRRVIAGCVTVAPPSSPPQEHFGIVPLAITTYMSTRRKCLQMLDSPPQEAVALPATSREIYHYLNPATTPRLTRKIGTTSSTASDNQTKRSLSMTDDERSKLKSLNFVID